MNNKLVSPKKIQGFWELMPKDEVLFEDMLGRLKRVFETNCFLPLDTPVAEFAEVLLAKSGGDVDKEIYRFTKGHADICLRYDLTVPLARFVAGNFNELDFPFKRYQIGKVYRGERPQKGRFREFYQCDADVIGEELPLSYDAECIYLYKPAFKALNLEVVVEISNRNILAGLFESFGKDIEPLMVIIDKLDKLDRDEIVNLLTEKGLNSEQIEKTLKIAGTSGDIEKVLSLKTECENATYLKGIDDLACLDELLKALGVENRIFNLSIVRGHNYYTGTVFECYLLGKRNLGAVGGGGRYDNLCKNFLDKKLQGVGMSIGITRLFDILKSENLLKEDERSFVTVGIITFEETLNYGLQIMASLRENGIRAEILNETKSFKAKMKEANKRQIEFVLILGEDEVKEQLFTLKNMTTGEQEKLNLESIIEKLS